MQDFTSNVPRNVVTCALSTTEDKSRYNFFFQSIQSLSAVTVLPWLMGISGLGVTWLRGYVRHSFPSVSDSSPKVIMADVWR